MKLLVEFPVDEAAALLRSRRAAWWPCARVKVTLQLCYPLMMQRSGSCSQLKDLFAMGAWVGRVPGYTGGTQVDFAAHSTAQCKVHINI